MIITTSTTFQMQNLCNVALSISVLSTDFMFVPEFQSIQKMQVLPDWVVLPLHCPSPVDVSAHIAAD